MKPGEQDTMDGTTVRRMRSGAVALGLVSGLAVALTSCDSSSPDTRCLDTSNYKAVAAKLCNNEPDGGYSDADRYQWYQQGGNSSYVSGYHRYYGSGTTTRSKSGTKGSTSSGDDGSTGEGVSRGGIGGHGDGGHGG